MASTLPVLSVCSLTAVISVMTQTSPGNPCCRRPVPAPDGLSLPCVTGSVRYPGHNNADEKPGRSGFIQPVAPINCKPGFAFNTGMLGIIDTGRHFEAVPVRDQFKFYIPQYRKHSYPRRCFWASRRASIFPVHADSYSAHRTVCQVRLFLLLLRKTAD